MKDILSADVCELILLHYFFFQNKPKYRYSMNASDGQGQNKSGFGFCVNSTSDSILSNGAYLSEKNTLHVHSFKNK